LVQNKSLRPRRLHLCKKILSFTERSLRILGEMLVVVSSKTAGEVFFEGCAVYGGVILVSLGDQHVFLSDHHVVVFGSVSSMWN